MYIIYIKKNNADFSLIEKKKNLKEIGSAWKKQLLLRCIL